MSKERADELRGEADRLEKRIQGLNDVSDAVGETSSTYTDHLQRRADHCRRLARDEEQEFGGES